jgi:hypothetical protein
MAVSLNSLSGRTDVEYREFMSSMEHTLRSRSFYKSDKLMLIIKGMRLTYDELK